MRETGRHCLEQDPSQHCEKTHPMTRQEEEGVHGGEGRGAGWGWRRKGCMVVVEEEGVHGGEGGGAWWLRRWCMVVKEVYTRQ